MPGCYRSVTDAGYVSRGMTMLPIDPLASSGAVAAPAPRPGWRTLRGANVGDRLYRGALTALALVLPLLLLTLLAELVVSAWPAIKQFGLPFVWNSVWDPVAGGGGAAPGSFSQLVRAPPAFSPTLLTSPRAGGFVHWVCAKHIQPYVRNLVY